MTLALGFFIKTYLCWLLADAVQGTQEDVNGSTAVWAIIWSSNHQILQFNES